MKKQLLSLSLLSAAWLAGNNAWAQHEGDHTYNDKGICTIDGCTDKFQPASSDEDGWYLLGNVGNVEWFSAQIADGNSTYKAKLTADIDYEGLGENYHTPIGNYGQKFIGKFDGCGYSIKNMVLVNPTRPKTDGSDGYGFFGCVRLGGGNGANLVEIKNLTIDSSCSVSADKNYVSGLIGRISENNADCTVRIENCINKASVTSTTNGNAGGLIGQINNPGGTGRTIEIINCENQGAITATTNNAGGLVGQVNVVTLNITNSTNTGSVSAKNYAAGILAQINAAAVVKISGCENRGVITTKELAAAGIASQINNQAATLTIESCMNLGNISCTDNQTNSKNAGSIFGANTSSNGNSKIVIRNCGNRGSVSGRTENAALVGWIGGNVGQGHRIENCWNTGEVTGISPESNTMYRGSASVSNIFNTKSDQQGTKITDDQVSSGELCYLLNGDQSEISWWQNLTGTKDAYPVLSSEGHAQVYQNATYLCPNVTSGSVEYSNNNSSTIPPHDYVDGVCSVCSGYEVPTLENEYYQLDNYGKIKWFENYANDGHPENNAELLANINFNGNSCRIGNATYPYRGIFKGNDHIISNFTINNDQMVQGFFGFITGGADISGLTFDNTCSISCTAKAGIVGSTKGSGTVKLTRLGNEGTVTVTNENAAGIIGTDENSSAILLIDQCYSTGAITGDRESAQIAGWTGSNSKITNSWSCSEVTGFDTDRHFSRYGGSGDTQYINCYTKYNDNTKGLFYTSDGFASGLVAAALNHAAGKTVCYQNLTGSVDTYPVLDSSHSQVYGHDYNVYCDNTYASGGTFDNVAPSSFTQLDHDYNTMGICIYDCEGITHFEEPTLSDSYYQLRNAGNVEWFSAKVASGDLNINGMLMNDIDFNNIENLHSPIGPDTGKKYNGIFDGQGFRIKNMIINRPDVENQGFFCFLRGNYQETIIRNLIIDKSCSITGKENVGGIAANGQNNELYITIENCVNEAAVTSKGQNAGGIIGASTSNYPKWKILNCVNAGKITAENSAPFAGALAGWIGNNGNCVISNCINVGEIIGYNGNSRMGRTAGTKTNLIDAGTGATSSNDYYCSESASTGALTYYANQQAGSTVFYQTIGIDDYPVPFNTHGIVNHISSAGYTTQYIPSTDVTIPTDVEAYAGVINGSAIRLVAIEDAISKEDAVVLKGSEGYYSFVPTTGVSQAAENDLKGSDGNVQGGDGIYALAIKNDKVGFYPVGNGVTIPEGKAYLEYTPSSGSGEIKGFTFVFDEDATSIQAINNGQQTTDGAIYNLAGQRLQKMQKGINIINGKKVLF